MTLQKVVFLIKKNKKKLPDSFSISDKSSAVAGRYQNHVPAKAIKRCAQHSAARRAALCTVGLYFTVKTGKTVSIPLINTGALRWGL